MKSRILIISVIASFLFVFCTSKVDESKKVPNKEAKEWRKNLENSTYQVYQEFDGAVLNYEELKSHLNVDTHLKLYMGCNLNADSTMEYRLFRLYITGKEVEQRYTNDYSTITYFSNGEWISCEKDELQTWSSNWAMYLIEKGLTETRAYVVPNADILALRKGEIYVSFGLKMTDTTEEVKALFCNKHHGHKGEADEMVDAPFEELNMDACMPCPKVCAENELP